MKSRTKFKQTEIGLIPEDWEVKTIHTIAEVVGGGTPSTKNPAYWDGDIPWITPRDLSNFRFRYIEKGERNITKEGLQNSSARLVPEGTILLTTRAPGDIEEGGFYKSRVQESNPQRRGHNRVFILFVKK